MTVSRPLFNQNLPNYTADELRGLLDAVATQPGVVRNGCTVTAASPVSMNVVVATGFVIVGAKSSANGKYLVEVTSPDTVPITAAAATTRVDQIVMEVLDTAFGDASDLAHIIAVPGGTGGALTPLTANQLPLARVTVAPGSTSITAGNITDVRTPSNPSPLGRIAQTTGPAILTEALSTWRDIISVTAPVIIGRDYRITGYHRGYQVSVQGFARSQLIDDQGGQTYIAVRDDLAVGYSLLGTGVLYMHATSTRTATWRVQAMVDAGGFRSNPNYATLLVEDIGVG